MHTRLRTALLLSTLLSTGLCAQVTPPGAGSQLGGAGAGFPFSYTGYVRYQQAIDKSYLQPGLLYGMSFRSTTRVRNVPERQWQEMTVNLADLPFASVRSMSGTFANNLGRNVTQVFKGRVNLYRPNPADPLEFSVTIAFDKPFLYLGTAPLVVEMLPDGYEGFPRCGSGGNGTSMDGTADPMIASVLGKGTCTARPTSAKASGAGGFVIQFFTAPVLMPFGKGCPGSNGKIPRIGSTGSATLGSNFAFTLRDAATNSNGTILAIGLSNTLDNNTRLPMDLTGITSVQGCWQNVDLLLLNVLPVINGQAALQVQIPNNAALKGVPVYSQFVVDDPSAGGFSTTAGGLLRVQ